MSVQFDKFFIYLLGSFIPKVHRLILFQRLYVKFKCMISFAGMGSLQNLNRSSGSLAQLSRAAIPSASPSSAAPGNMGFNSAVGGGRVTPTSSSPNSSSFNSAVGGHFSGFGSSQQPPQLSRQLGILQPTNSMPSASVVSGRNPLFSRDRGKM